MLIKIFYEKGGTIQERMVDFLETQNIYQIQSSSYNFR